MTIVEYMVYFYSRKEVTGKYAKIIYNSIETAKLPNKPSGYVIYSKVNISWAKSEYKVGWKLDRVKSTPQTAFAQFIQLEINERDVKVSAWHDSYLLYDKDYKIQLSPKEEILVAMLNGDPMAMDLLTDILESRR